MSVATKRKTGVKQKRRKGLVSTVAVAHITSTSNNTIITIADLNGDTLGSSSGGAFQKGSRKATPFAAQEAAKEEESEMACCMCAIVVKLTYELVRILGLPLCRDDFILRAIEALFDTR